LESQYESAFQLCAVYMVDETYLKMTYSRKILWE